MLQTSAKMRAPHNPLERLIMRCTSASLRLRSLFNRMEQLEQRTVFAAGLLDTTFGSGGSVRTEFDASTTYGDTALATVVDSGNRVIAAGEGGMARFLPDGKIDTGFGPDGRVPLPFYTRAVALQSDGKIVIAGGTAKFNSTDLMVARFLASGQLDTSFDGDGIAQIDVGGLNEWATALMIEPSGRIVVAGGAESAMAIARLLPSGQLDTSFSSDGWLVHQVNHTDTAYGLARQANGRILVVGTSLVTQGYPQTNFDMSVLRLNTNGSIDATFGFSGMAYANFAFSLYSRDQGSGIAVQADGKIVVSGSAYSNFRSYTAVARFLTDGSLDNDFGSNGRTTVPVGQDIVTSSVVPLDDGRLLVSNYQGLLALNSAGVLDTTIDGDGVVFANGSVRAMARQGDGAILLAGSFQSGFGVKRLLANGTTDTSFSADGVAGAPMGASVDSAVHSALQADGKIIVVGGDQRGQFQIARYLTDGGLDTSFSTDGLLTIQFGEQYYYGMANAVAVQSDGRIVLAGTLRENNNPTTYSRIGLARLNIDGSLDSSFSGDGLVISELTGSAEASSMLVQPDGRIVVAGAWNDSATLWRFNSDGSYDTRFSGDGVTSMASVGTLISSIVLQPDGRILAAGYQRPSSFLNTGFGSVLMVARFNANGSLDSTFGVKGKMLDPGSRQRTADDIVLLPDGRFAVVGDTTFYRQGIETSQMAVSRYNPDGSIDGPFGTRLIDQYESFGYNDFESVNVTSWSSTLLRQPDGKLVVGGYSDRRLVVARINEDGSPDSSFGGDGLTDTLLPNHTLRPTNVLLQPDGKLIISGTVRATTGFGIQDFYVQRLTSEPLPTYSASVRINAQGNVEIFDAWGRDDRLKFERTADAIIVSDTTTDSQSRFRVINLPEVAGDGSRQVTIPLTLVQATGKPLLVNGMDGDDDLTFDASFEAPATGFVFKAGNGFDRVLIPQSPVPVAWVLSTIQSGSARPQGKVPINFNGIEGLTGGTQSDSFRLVYQPGSLMLRIDGGAGQGDSIELRADANMSFSYQPIVNWGQRLLVDGASGLQTITLRNINSAKLSGGASNNRLDAREFWGSATIYGAAGDDFLVGARLSSALYGDDGNDQLLAFSVGSMLRGGRGDDLLVGYYGDDTLYGDDGQDILVGDSGRDQLFGGNGDDLLIGGNCWALNLFTAASSREAVLETWRSTDSYTTKIQKLSVDGVGLDNSIKLRSGSAVSDDLAVDTFFGNAGSDWFVLNLNTELNLPTGGLRDKAANEQYSA